jgi:hypothetical protein
VGHDATVATTRVAYLLAALLLAAACADADVVDEPNTQGPAPLAALVGPWSATPFVLDPQVGNVAAQVCRRDIELGDGAVAAVVDARGAGVITLRMTGARPGGCNALQILPSGQIVGAGGGWGGGGAERLAPLVGVDLGSIERQTVNGGDLKVEGWSVYGRAGPGIATVVVFPVGGPQVLATRMNDWFAAWWPRLVGDPPLEGRGPPGFPKFTVRGYDPLGALVNEVSQ